MPTAQYTLLVDWNHAGTFTHSSGDITTRVYSVECHSGRDFDSHLFSKPVAGGFRALVDNRNGDYNPLNVDSPLYGSVLPGRRIQLRTGSGNILWMGFLESIVPGPKVDGFDTVTFEAVGPLGVINDTKVQTGMHVTSDTAFIVNHVLNTLNWGDTPPFGGRVGIGEGSGIVTPRYFWTGTITPLEILRQLEELEGVPAQMYETTNGEIGFANRYFRLTTNRCTTSQATFSDSTTGTLSYSAIQQEDPLRYINNEVRAVVSRATVNAITTLWIMPEGSHNTSSPLVPANGSMVITGFYPGRGATANAVGVDYWFTPNQGTVGGFGQFWANSSPTGGGLNMSTLIALSAIDNGNQIILTANNTSNSDAYITKIEVIGASVVLGDPQVISVRDATSQSRHGTRSYPLTSEFFTDRTEAEAACRRLLDIFKSPLPLITVTINANRSTAHLNQVCSRITQDRITLVATGSAGLKINEDFFVERVAHRIDRHKNHITTWHLSPVIVAGTSTSTSGTGSGSTGFWILGSSSLDSQTKLEA